MPELEQGHSQTKITKQPPDLRFCRAWWLFKKALYPKLGNAALRVFLVLEDRASRWNDYQVPMSLSTLAEETGVKHHTTLAAGIRELEAAGIIAVTRQAGNSRLANSYALLIRDLIGAEQAVFSSRSNSGNGSSSNTGSECDCAGECETIASNGGSCGSMGNAAANPTRFTEDASPANSRTAGKAGNRRKSKVIGDGKICNNRNYPATRAVASDAPTSAENEPLEAPAVSSGSAKIDSVLTCNKNTTSTNKNRINWLNPDGFNGVTAAKIPPVKAKSDQRQGQSQSGHGSSLPGEHEPASLVTCSDALNKCQPGSLGQVSGKRQAGHAKAGSKQGSVGVAKSRQVQAQSYGQHENFEAKSYSGFCQPQSRNIRQLREEYFKRLSWAMSTRERMAVLFAALRVALGEGQALDKAEFSGVQALVNEYGYKAVLGGIVTTVGKGIDQSVYFAYLRGVIRQQAQQQAHDSRDKVHYRHATGSAHYQVQLQLANANAPLRYQQQLPIDLAKYTGTGKYAHAATMSCATA